MYLRERKPRTASGVVKQRSVMKNVARKVRSSVSALVLVRGDIFDEIPHGIRR